MPATKISPKLYYYVGETPPALPFRHEDEDGVLISSISGATITAKCKVDDNEEFDVSCTNSDDGTGTIDWSDSDSDFDNAGVMKIDLEVDDGSLVWFMPRFSIPIKNR